MSRRGIRHRTSGTPDRELRDVAATSASPPPKQLDLVHVTAVGAGREIVRSGEIETRLCRCFNKDLVYLFVARPAYRHEYFRHKTDQVNRFPFVFVVDPVGLDPPYHVYPFDTGAAMAGIYGDLADPFVFLEDYELDPRLDAASAHINWAFETPEKYYRGELRTGLRDTLKSWQTVAAGFLTIAQMASSSHNRPDKRASAVEIAYTKHISLKKNVKLVILPKQYMENGSVKNIDFIRRLTELEIDWDWYDWQPNERPDFYFDCITNIVSAYLRRRNQI
jgi:hypothetical protein